MPDIITQAPRRKLADQDARNILSRQPVALACLAIARETLATFGVDEFLARDPGPSQITHAPMWQSAPVIPPWPRLPKPHVSALFLAATKNRGHALRGLGTSRGRHGFRFFAVATLPINAEPCAACDADARHALDPGQGALVAGRQFRRRRQGARRGIAEARL